MKHHFHSKFLPFFRNARTSARIRRVLVIACFGLLAACAGNDELDTELSNLTQAYQDAKDAIANQNYSRGIQIFEAIQARYPFSDLSRQIQLELMYAYYKSGEQEQAIDAADTFMRENPIHERVDYALYIKALSSFEDQPGMLERRFHKDITMRPPKDVQLAYASLRRLVERYPASEYAADARQRMIFIKNRLAAYENHVADYYIRRGAFVAALNRAKFAVEAYNGADSNQHSLELMIEAYEHLGMHDLAADTRRVLETTFPSDS